MVGNGNQVEREFVNELPIRSIRPSLYAVTPVSIVVLYLPKLEVGIPKKKEVF